MKKLVSGAVMLASLTATPAFSAESLITGKELQNRHTSCMNAWKRVFVDGDITGREVVQNVAVGAGTAAAGSLALKASSSLTTSAKLVVFLGTTAGLVTLANMEAQDQFEALAAIKKDALLGSGEVLGALSETMIREGKATSAKQVEEAVNSITDYELKAICTNDNNPIIFGRYIELLIGKLKR